MRVTITRDLRAMFGPIRDQGTRPTCLACAASDSHAALRDGRTPLSCEFAFYHAQQRARRSPHQGATLTAVLDTLREDGQPVEADWPYLASMPVDVNTWGPPRTVGHVFRRAGERRSHGFDVIAALVDEDRPALVLMMLSDAFYTPSPAGVVVAPPAEAPDRTRRHAVVAVAHGTVDGERAVLVRNSWGSAWGADGHAWLTEAFLAPRLTHVAVLTEEINVPAD